MPLEGLAKMAAAQLMCKVLFERGELDGNLNPVGKESLKYAEPEFDSSDDEDSTANPVPREERPRAGTTKRRQYYYKKVRASVFPTES
jgi:hypothetical protein